MRGKSTTCRCVPFFPRVSDPNQAVIDRNLLAGMFRQVGDLPRIGVAEPVLSSPVVQTSSTRPQLNSFASICVIKFTNVSGGKSMTQPARRAFSLIVFALLIANVASVSAQDDRAADRAAIKAHIDSIFQAFIKKDVAALRATHAENWLGYLDNSGRMLKGINDYMDWNQLDPKSPYGMKSYTFRDFDMIFKGDAAFVCFVADVESNPWPGNPAHRVLQICDFYNKNDGKWIQSGSYTGQHQETVEEQLASPRSLGDEMKK